MARNKKGTVPPSVSGVSGHDIYNCFATLWGMPEVKDITVNLEDRLETRVLIVCEVTYLLEGQEWICTSQDIWTPWSAPIQTHIYRCLFNAAIDVERALAGMASLTSMPVETSSPEAK